MTGVFLKGTIRPIVADRRALESELPGKKKQMGENRLIRESDQMFFLFLYIYLTICWADWGGVGG